MYLCETFYYITLNLQANNQLHVLDAIKSTLLMSKYSRDLDMLKPWIKAYLKASITTETAPIKNNFVLKRLYSFLPTFLITYLILLLIFYVIIKIK